MNKYKVGDRVLIKSWDDMEKEFGLDEYGNIKIGFVKDMKKFCNKEFKIIKRDEDGDYILENDNWFYFYDDMIERKVDDMTKSDLKSGMIIETRDGERYITIVKEDCEINFMNLQGGTYLDDCELLDDMTDNIDNTYDIMKIYKMDYTLNDCKITQNLIWERKEVKEMTIKDIEKELGYNIKIIN